MQLFEFGKRGGLRSAHAFQAEAVKNNDGNVTVPKIEEDQFLIGYRLTNVLSLMILTPVLVMGDLLIRLSVKR